MKLGLLGWLPLEVYVLVIIIIEWLKDKTLFYSMYTYIYTYIYILDRILYSLIGQKPLFSQSIKHSKSVFYCFSATLPQYHKENEEALAVYY